LKRGMTDVGAPEREIEGNLHEKLQLLSRTQSLNRIPLPQVSIFCDLTIQSYIYLLAGFKIE